MMETEVKAWVATHPLSPIEVDCAIAVMLKILDGKCKMASTEKEVMTLLYEQVKQLPNQLLDKEIHQLIAKARQHLDDEQRLFIYEKRVLAETMISRPVMKGFKARLRAQGLFKQEPNADDDEVLYDTGLL